MTIPTGDFIPKEMRTDVGSSSPVSRSSTPTQMSQVGLPDDGGVLLDSIGAKQFDEIFHSKSSDSAVFDKMFAAAPVKVAIILTGEGSGKENISIKDSYNQWKAQNS